MAKFGYGQTQPLRTVSLKVAADEEFRMKNRLTWRSDIQQLVRYVSKDFEKHFGLRFKIGTIDHWVSDVAQDTMLGLLNDLRKKVPQGDCDIVLGFTSQHGLTHDLSGAATYLHGYILLREQDTKSIMRLMLKHELCHLFGAADLNEKNSIMNSRNPEHSFCEFTTRIILINKHRSFNPYVFPLPVEKKDEAISIYEERKRLDRREIDIHILLAIFYLEKKDYESTVNECLQARQLDADSPDILNLTAIALRRQGKIDQAIQEYQKVILLQPNLPDVHYNLGIAYSKKGETDKALEAYLKAIELNPNYATAYSNLGHL